MPTSRDPDPSFLALPLKKLAQAALLRAADFNAEHADFRLERLLSQRIALRDGLLVDASQTEDLGFAVRVIVDGAWGFAAGSILTADEVVRVTEQAVRLAMVAKPLAIERIELAAEAVYDDVTWVSAYEVDPFDVPLDDKVTLLADWSARLLADPVVDHVSASVHQVRENKFYADSHGTATTQQRVRLHPEVTIHGADPSKVVHDSMRTIAPPVGRGWEYLTGTGYDWDAELSALPGHLRERLTAPGVKPGDYDLVVDPSNLWLTIHESIGHATELDRALGYEANYAGTSFATTDNLNTLQYGSPIMHVTGDRTVEHGLSTIGYDDDGVATGQWDLIRDGILVGYQTDRRMAAAMGFERSNGCAYADSPGHIPIQRMANVSLQPSAADITTADLFTDIERGIYVVGDKSWSIDMQRYNFQFTGQRFYEIRDGQLDGQLRDVAYQATTTDFWRSMDAVGGPSTWVLGGAFNCGKAQPGQVAAVSHGCPAARFRGVRILNTTHERGA